MELGELLTRWTVRAALALYVVALILRATSPRRRSTWSRLAWTLGCLAFLLHVLCALHFVHHWSHEAAYEETARRTAEVVGFAWGGGLFANYLFTLLWMADVCWWWWDAAGYLLRPRVVEWVVQGFLGFMAFNATVVFGVGAIRWAGLAGALLLAAAWGYAARRDRLAAPQAGA